ncbi:MAG: glycerate kinase type-2 family protein [Omnitrophica WOR_2 bacterium]
MTASLRSSHWGERIARILFEAVQAVEPGQAIGKFCQREGSTFLVADQPYDLNHHPHVFLAGAGKAGAPMAVKVGNILGPYLTNGIVVVKEGYLNISSLEKVKIYQAGHPIPDERGVQATHLIQGMLRECRQDDLVIYAISGGGSALLTSPVADVSLESLQELTNLLLSRGATINEINTLRKHLDEVKGGKLARIAGRATQLGFILSDVVGDPLDVIASGPTAPDPTTYSQAYEVLERYGLQDSVANEILKHIQAGMKGEIPDNPKEDDPLFTCVRNRIIGSNRQAAEAALEQARKEGFQTLILTNFLQGEARQAGQFLGSIARQVAVYGSPISRPACILAGGETTVTVTGNGSGGRNQEMALGAVHALAGLKDIALVTLATDGGDGPTDAAGAVVTGDTLERAHKNGMEPQANLKNNDAYHFFNRLGDLLKPGPTLTNVNDLTFLFAF